jgi:hypothetical protein
VTRLKETSVYTIFENQGTIFLVSLFDRIREFDATISDWVLNTEEGETPESHPWKITEFDLKMLKDKVEKNGLFTVILVSAKQFLFEWVVNNTDYESR